MNVGSSQLVAVSPLPDAATFLHWERDGFTRWISLCGVGASDLLDQDDPMAALEGLVFRLSDPFSQSEPWDGEEQLAARVFLEYSSPVLRANLLQAVRALVQSLEQGERVVVFCHLGLSRSPLVAAAGLMLACNLPPLEAWAALAREHPDLQLTRLALAALIWLESTSKSTTNRRGGNDLS